MNNYKAEKATHHWLKLNGVSAKHFVNTDILLLQAQRAAHNLLKTHGYLLNTDQIRTLKAYSNAMAHQQTLASVTKTQAYRVLNIGTSTRRQLFRRQKQFN